MYNLCTYYIIEECREIKDWFSILGENKEEVWDKIWSEDLDERKGEVLVRIWKGKEKAKRVKEEKNMEKKEKRK